jgi:hypothetical protein
MKRILILLLVLSFPITLFARSPLTFEERVKAQEAIERVYYNHRIWPKENPQPKPPFEKMVTKEQIEAKVTDYLKKCSALDQFWQRPIEPKQLQAEMDRMAKGTKDPQTLNELFRALNDDPYLIAECLARPVLADRLIHNWYTNDERFHKETRSKAEEARKTLTTESFCEATEGQYSRIIYKLEMKNSEPEMEKLDPEDRSIKLDEKEFAEMLSEIQEEGIISQVVEKKDCFVIMHTISKNEIEIEIETLSFAKQDIDSWLISQDLSIKLPETDINSTSHYLPPMLESGCTEGWDNGILDDTPPSERAFHTAIWTGTEMIVWGFSFSGNDGGIYNPSTDNWRATSVGTNCPSKRNNHTAVWTGTEMVIWGGDLSNNTGGRYNPQLNTWIATSTGTNCPNARWSPTAVWTGTEMIVWGGDDGYTAVYNTGGRYNPQTDTWMATSTGTGCPSARYGHTAIWTGTEMIIWGGSGGGNTGGRYNPSGDSWITTSTGTNCPSARYGHKAVWTGSVMIIWGGWTGSSFFQSGGCYNPATDTWIATSTGAGCPSARYRHDAVWTGTEMIIWGGALDYPDPYENYHDGGRYNPSTDTWIATSTGTNCPTARWGHSAVWTGSEMIIWGGAYWTSCCIPDNKSVRTGGRYNPTTDTWTPTSMGGSPSARYLHSAIWTGMEMIVWGGYDGFSYLNTGSRYNLSTDSWTVTSAGTNVPSGRAIRTAVWTGSEMIVWGGYGTSPAYKQDGGRYNPLADSWNTTSTAANCPSARRDHTAVWSGTKMIIWGGYTASSPYYTNTGGGYNPSTDIWNATSTDTDCPSVRRYHAGIWNGTEMIIWGGNGGSNVNTGGRYNPLADSWTATSTGTNVPSARYGHTAIWTGTEMIIWGGSGGGNTGGRYNPSGDSWITTSTGTNCPTARSSHTAVWTGSEMIAWGGYGSSTYKQDGGRYNPATDIWNVTSTVAYCPAGRSSHTAVWTGSEMIIWGGYYGMSSMLLDSGGIYYIPYSPSSFPNNTASDIGCPDTGVSISWSSPSNWGDSGSGTRTFDVLRDGNPIATGLSESALLYTDTTGDNGVSYLYQVRANNGCGLSTMTTGVSAADNVGTVLDEVASFNNVYSWDPVTGADGYRLYRGLKADLPNLKTSTDDGCIRYDGTAMSFDCSSDNPSLVTGKLYWYLVTAYTGVCEGTAGEGTGFTRNLSSSWSCP